VLDGNHHSGALDLQTPNTKLSEEEEVIPLSRLPLFDFSAPGLSHGNSPPTQVRVWVQVRRDGTNVGRMTQIKVPSTANIDDLSKAVLLEFAHHLASDDAADLVASTSADLADGQLKPYDEVPKGTTGPAPIYVHAVTTPEKTTGARRLQNALLLFFFSFFLLSISTPRRCRKRGSL
jgi:hypothetical protein